MMQKSEIPKIKRSVSLNDSLYNVIRRLIIQCVLEPGERVNIESLSKALGVSRTPLREVLQRLHTEGLINLIPRIGPIVAKLGLKEVEDAFAVRLSLEKMAIPKAIENIRLGDIRRMEQTISNTRDMIQENNYAKIVELNEKFHFILYRLSKNDLLIEYMKDIFAKIERTTYFLSRLDRFVSFATDDHEIILECMKMKNPDSAMEKIEKHVLSSYENLKRLLVQNKENKGLTDQERLVV